MNQVGALHWHPEWWRAAIAAVAVGLGACASGSAAPASAPSPVTSPPPTVTPSSVAAASTTIATTTIPTAPAGPPARLERDFAAEELAGEITRVERLIRSDAEGAAVAEAGRRQQLLYRYLTRHAELDEAVLTLVGADVAPFVAGLVGARQVVQSGSPGTPSPTLPAWSIVEPLAPDQLLTLYQQAESETGVPWYYLAAINFQETRMGRIVGTSSAGAIGPMQFLPSTWAACCVGDPTNPADAILGAATYLAQSGAPADMPAALHEYNPNAGYVATVTAVAENIRDDPRAFYGFYAWQVFYVSASGTVRLPIGYAQQAQIDAAAYIADHPQDVAG